MNNIRKVGLNEEHGRRSPDRVARGWAPNGRTSLDTTDPLSPWTTLARAIEGLLTPVTPRKAFRDQLYGNLIESGRRQFAVNAVAHTQAPNTDWQQRVTQFFSTGSRRVDKRWLWGAAAVGSAVSVAGIVAIALRHREHRASTVS